jgi:hypothetical protein
LPVSESFPHIVHDDPDSSGTGTRDGLTSGAQDWIAQKTDAVNRHGFSAKVGGGTKTSL